MLPSSPEWPAYLQAAADAGFPPSCSPNGHLGSWDVRVEDREWEARLAGVLHAHGLAWRPVDGAASLRCFRLDRFEKVRAALTEAFADCILPPRETMERPEAQEPPRSAPHAGLSTSARATVSDLFAPPTDPTPATAETAAPDVQTSLF